MITVSQIRDHLLNFLDTNNPLSLDDFEDWLVSASWNMHQDSDPAAQKFAASIELRLAEFSSGEQPERRMRNELLNLLNEYSIPIPSVASSVTYGTLGDFRIQPWPFVSAHKSLSVAS